MKNDRQPEYTRDRAHRIVSVANDRWQRQERSAEKGTREFDNWLPCGKQCDYDTAAAWLAGKQPAGVKVA